MQENNVQFQLYSAMQLPEKKQRWLTGFVYLRLPLFVCYLLEVQGVKNK